LHSTKKTENGQIMVMIPKEAISYFATSIAVSRSVITSFHIEITLKGI